MDITRLTIGEMAAVEDMSGQPISHFGNEDKPQSKLLAALVTVLKKRDDRNFKFQDALNMTTDELSDFLGDDEDEDPKAQN